MLTLKRELNSIVAKKKQNEKAGLAEESSQEKRESIRSSPSTSRVLCTLLSIIGKRFQDTGLKDLCMESRVVAEGSVSSLLEGRSYKSYSRPYTCM